MSRFGDAWRTIVTNSRNTSSIILTVIYEQVPHMYIIRIFTFISSAIFFVYN